LNAETRRVWIKTTARIKHNVAKIMRFKDSPDIIYAGISPYRNKAKISKNNHLMQARMGGF